MKKYVFLLLALWITAEFSHQVYVAETNRIDGQFSWAYFAYSRNKPAIDKLYTVAGNSLQQRLFIEIRGGVVLDSTGFIPAQLKDLVLGLANDIEPAGIFYFDFTPIKAELSSVTVTTACPTCSSVSGCQCIDFFKPVFNGGALLQLQNTRNTRRDNFNTLEYIRNSNSSLKQTLDDNPCFFSVGNNAYLKREKADSTFPIAYNEEHWDLLITKLLLFVVR
ncbi:MAG: hypothetical protein ACRYFX_04045 [Janthinobacterium lividum]